MYRKSQIKKVDIIMPNFNKGQYLKEAIDSVINQSFKKWKLLIIDDNSSDNSKNILKKYIKRKNIKIFFLKKNKGPAYCRNLGLRLCKSKFIAFLDSDDLWMKNKLKQQLKFMEKNKYPFTFTDYLPVIQNKNKKIRLNKTKIDYYFNFKKFIKNSSINTSTIVLEKKYIKDIKFRNLKLMEDYIFKCDLMKKTSIPFQKLNSVSAIYRIISLSRSSKKFNNLIYLWKINKLINKLSIFDNLASIFFISINSLKKYGFK